MHSCQVHSQQTVDELITPTAHLTGEEPPYTQLLTNRGATDSEGCDRKRILAVETSTVPAMGNQATDILVYFLWLDHLDLLLCLSPVHQSHTALERQRFHLEVADLLKGQYPHF